jgi:uncharacterized DUF497 family protein
MQFEWNINKNQLNKKKHGLSFEIASFVFEDPYLLSVPDNRYHYSEERWQSLGLIQQVLIYIAHTVKEDDNGEEIIRIISARAATSSETKQYYANRKHGERT